MQLELPGHGSFLAGHVVFCARTEVEQNIERSSKTEVVFIIIALKRMYWYVLRDKIGVQPTPPSSVLANFGTRREEMQRSCS